MKIGVPKEIKPQEARVGVDPCGCTIPHTSLGIKLSIQEGSRSVLSGISR
jgi:alanine dehydrogenase